MATNLPSCLLIQFLKQLLTFLANFTLLKYVKSQRSYGFLITKELIFAFQILDLKDHFSASLRIARGDTFCTVCAANFPESILLLTTDITCPNQSSSNYNVLRPYTQIKLGVSTRHAKGSNLFSMGAFNIRFFGFNDKTIWRRQIGHILYTQ